MTTFSRVVSHSWLFFSCWMKQGWTPKDGIIVTFPFFKDSSSKCLMGVIGSECYWTKDSCFWYYYWWVVLVEMNKTEWVYAEWMTSLISCWGKSRRWQWLSKRYYFIWDYYSFSILWIKYLTKRILCVEDNDKLGRGWIEHLISLFLYFNFSDCAL